MWTTLVFDIADMKIIVNFQNPQDISKVINKQILFKGKEKSCGLKKFLLENYDFLNSIAFSNIWNYFFGTFNSKISENKFESEHHVLKFLRSNLKLTRMQWHILKGFRLPSWKHEIFHLVSAKRHSKQGAKFVILSFDKTHYKTFPIIQ